MTAVEVALGGALALPRWLRVGGTIVGGIAATVILVAIAANVLWDRATAQAVASLTQHGAASAQIHEGPAIQSEAQLDGLPIVVQRYFRFALRPGQRSTGQVRVEQEGLFTMRPNVWSSFTATQHFTTQAPGFVWDATIRMAPALSVRVRDSYVGGVGAMEGRVAAVVRVVNQHGTPEMAASSLQRYLAELPWLPPGLLPSAGVRWTALDDSTARATISDAGLTVSADFHFGALGEIVGMSTDRYRDVRGTPVLMPWVGRFWDYERVDGMMIPRQGEIAWVLPEGTVPYFRVRIVSATYEPAGNR